MYSYAFKWAINKQTTLFGNYNSTMNPNEKHYLGIKSHPSKKVALFSELKVNMHNKTEMNVGTRISLPDGQVTTSVSSGFKLSTIWRHQLDFGALTFQASTDLSKPKQPTNFGLTISLGPPM